MIIEKYLLYDNTYDYFLNLKAYSVLKKCSKEVYVKNIVWLLKLTNKIQKIRNTNSKLKLLKCKAYKKCMLNKFTPFFNYSIK